MLLCDLPNNLCDIFLMIACYAETCCTKPTNIQKQLLLTFMGVGIDQSVQQLATSWTVRRSNPVGARFSAPVQTGPGAHPASCTMGTGSFSRVKRPGHGVDQPSPSSAEIKERVEVYLYSPSGSPWPVLGLTLPLLTVIVHPCILITTRCRT